MKTVGVIVGSLRRNSINRKLAQAVARLASGRLDFRFIEIGDLPLYNDDLWQPAAPEPVLRMKRAVNEVDALLFVTPEYNRSFTPAIKNAIDWGSRPRGDNSWEAKPAGIIGTSPGAIGAAVGQNALKGLLTVVDTVLMGQPEVYLSWKAESFDDATHEVLNPDTKLFLMKFVDRFCGWIDLTAQPRTDAQADAKPG
ncbi:MAG TPA: NADPH-dependent FMN reductase [Burkholderiaceae bacterium]|nr:NADPH-dependent FMN reductase [Burkholderiaceae bacterium]